MLYSDTLLIALSFGIIPTVFWLLFWLYEDRARPEPRGLVLKTFIAGMLVVPFVIPFQKAGFSLFGLGTIAFIIVSITEEFFKYVAARFTGLGSKENDEPLDPVIYMITASLGFASVENTLFLLQDAQLGGTLQSLVITGNLRFIGATLLHVVTSATIGVFISLAFYKKKSIKRIFLLFGLILAIILHTLFNLLIIHNINTSIFITFTFVWVSVIILLLMFEKIKTIRPFKRFRK